MIGAWKSFDDLEDSLTLDELFEIYGSILETEAETFRRDASLQGVQLPEINTDDDEEEYQESLKERIARKKAEETGDDTELNRIRFGEGQGHVVIGG